MTSMTRLNTSLLLGICALLTFGVPSHAQERAAPAPSRLVVVELFQSQGCSSCPPAEANLNAIAGQPGILALSFGVTYWDSLGWKDTFATAAYTDRQWAYAHHRGRDNVWTPQIYIGGHADLVGTDRAQLARAIAQATSQGPKLSWGMNRLSIGTGTAAKACDVWLVRYDPRTQEVAVKAGENNGRTLPHRNIVRALTRIGRWSGAAASFTYAAAAPGLATAILVQAPDGGPILAAARG